MDKQKRGFPKSVAAIAVAVGIAAGSYGAASAATGSESSSSSSITAAPATFAAAAAPAPNGQAPWGMQRSDETLLTGTALSKVEAIAKAKVPNGTIVRVETDADGNAAYESHMTKSDGTPVTVYVNKDFEFVSVEAR
jgi:hypothetical protein